MQNNFDPMSITIYYVSSFKFLGIITLFASLFFVVACEVENTTADDKPVVMDTLDYTEVVRTDNFFCVSNTYTTVDNWMGGNDTSMNIITNRVAHYTGPEVAKKATININVSFPIPFEWIGRLDQISARGECIIKADKGHHLFKAGIYEKVVKSDGSFDTTKMDKIITGQTIRIFTEENSDSGYNWFGLFTTELLDVMDPHNTTVLTHLQKQAVVARGIDLLKENALSIQMKAVNSIKQVRIIASTSELDFSTDKELIISATYRSNYRYPMIGLSDSDIISKASVWKDKNARYLLLLGY